MKLNIRIAALLLMICCLFTFCAAMPTVATETITGANTSDGYITITQEEYDQLLKYKELEEIREIVEMYYYKDVDETTMLEGAAAGLLSSINDPYTFYYNPQAYADMWEDDEGEYVGVGMMITANYATNLCTISRVFLNSPALEAGIRKGDILTKVDDLDVTAVNLQDAVDIMRGIAGEPVNITVVRNNEPITFTVVRAKVNVNYVNSCMLDDQVGYISIYEFSGDISDEFKTQLNQLMTLNPKALVLDLRDNPGGWVTDAQKVADIFLGENTLATLQYKDGSTEIYRTYNSNDDVTDLPLVVLVNENSASSSEILSGALQDLQRATIVGVKSYGKGIVQWVLGVGDRGAGMQLTIAQYFTPNGNAVHGIGITPDVTAEMPEEEVSMLFELGDLNDTQLKVAYDTALSLIK